MTDDSAISVRGLSKLYTRGPETGWTLQQVVGDILLKPYRRLRGQKPPERQRQEPFWALKDVSFEVKRGERVAIIGRNGAGKSSLLKILSRVVYPTEGEARIRGRVTSLLEVGTGFNPNMTGRVNVYLNASMHGLTRREIDRKFDEIVDFAQIGPFVDTPIKRYSTGMRARLAFAVAAHLDPDILIMDEVLAVGDLAFQRKCLQRVQGMAGGDTTLLFVSHSMDAVVRFCTRAIWLEAGRVVADGPVREVAAEYAHGILDVKSSYVHTEPPAATGQVPEPAFALSTANYGARTASTTPPRNGTASHHNGHHEGRNGEGGSGAVAVLEANPAEVRLHAARLVSRQGLVVSVVPLDEQVGVEIEYEVANGSAVVLPCAFLYGDDGTMVFGAVPPETDPSRMLHAPGRHRAVAWLPANFLNAGTYTVGIALAGPDESPLRRYVQVPAALSFLSVEAEHGGARGLMPRKFPGLIRPMLDWELDIRTAAPDGART